MTRWNYLGFHHAFAESAYHSLDPWTNITGIKLHTLDNFCSGAATKIKS